MREGRTPPDQPGGVRERCKPGKYELPQLIKPGLAAVVNEYQDLFITLPGITLVASHQINTTGSPVRNLAQRIPAHFRDEVEEQLQQMLQKGIIVESSSPWLAPAEEELWRDKDMCGLS